MAHTHWVSLHTFLHDPAQTLRFLREWITPQIHQLRQSNVIAQWFFIRYWDGGPHLRLRFAVRQLADIVQFQQQLQQVIGTYQAAQPIAREQYYGAHQFDGASVDADSLLWYGDAVVVPIAYEPETVRYGGVAALSVNERLFQASSDLALRLCGAGERTAQQHLLTAMLLMAAGYLAFCPVPARAAQFFDYYAAYWRAYSSAAAAAEMAAGKSADAALVAKLREFIAAIGDGQASARLELQWAAQVRAAVDDFAALYRAGELELPATATPVTNDDEYAAAVEQMLSSQLHMMNNRLGVLPQQECYLARVLANAFGEMV